MSRQTVTSPCVNNDDSRVDGRKPKKVRTMESTLKEDEKMMSRRGTMS
jgi:hypothetical protein